MTEEEAEEPGHGREVEEEAAVPPLAAWEEAGDLRWILFLVNSVAAAAWQRSRVSGRPQAKQCTDRLCAFSGARGRPHTYLGLSSAANAQR